MAFDTEAARRTLRNREKDRQRRLDSLYERAVSDFEKIVSHLISKYDPIHIDLVELERIHPLHAQTIRSDGRLVYERK